MKILTKLAFLLAFVMPYGVATADSHDDATMDVIEHSSASHYENEIELPEKDEHDVEKNHDGKEDSHPETEDRAEDKDDSIDEKNDSADEKEDSTDEKNDSSEDKEDPSHT